MPGLEGEPLPSKSQIFLVILKDSSRTASGGLIQLEAPYYSAERHDGGILAFSDPFDFENVDEINEAREWVTKTVINQIKSELKKNHENYTDLSFKDRALLRWYRVSRYVGLPELGIGGPYLRRWSSIYEADFLVSSPEEIRTWWNELLQWCQEYDTQWLESRGGAETGGSPTLEKLFPGAWKSEEMMRTDLGISFEEGGLRAEWSVLEPKSQGKGKFGSYHYYSMGGK